MVCKIRSGKSIKGALNYNENKVREGQAEYIAAVNFIADPKDLNFYDKINRLEYLTGKNARAKTNTVHISLNFDVSEKLDQNILNDIASTYMTKIGFGDQPYLVYQHHDAAHPHLHIVTTNIQEDGKRIGIHNLGKNESENARKEIEIQYGLVQAQSQPRQKNLLLVKPEKAIYGKSETKRSISNIVSAVVRNYKFGSLPEFNAVLRQYNVIADRGKEGMRMYERNGLIYSLLDDQGNKIGVPIKASAISGKPTLKFLQDQFKLNQVLKTPHKERIVKTIDSFFKVTRRHTKVNFCDYMNFHGINASFRGNKDGKVYGLTFIDNKEGVVVLITGLGLLLLVALIVNGLLEGFMNKLQDMSPVTVMTVYIFNLLLTMLVVALLFAVVYKVLPDAVILWKDAAVGAIFAAVLFMVGKFGITLYIHSIDLGSTYGAAGSLVVLLFWVFYSSFALYFGVAFTKSRALAHGFAIKPKEYAITVKVVEVESDDGEK